MTSHGRLGCLRTLAGCVVGGLWGILATLLIGTINAPEVDPNDELAFEGYTPFVVLVVIPAGLIFGVILGSLVVNRFELDNGQAVAWGFAGWLVALAVGTLVFAGQWQPFFLFLHGLMTWTFVVAGFMLSEARTGKARRRALELRE